MSAVRGASTRSDDRTPTACRRTSCRSAAASLRTPLSPRPPARTPRPPALRSAPEKLWRGKDHTNASWVPSGSTNLKGKFLRKNHYTKDSFLPDLFEFFVFSYLFRRNIILLRGLLPPYETLVMNSVQLRTFKKNVRLIIQRKQGTSRLEWRYQIHILL